MRHTRATTLLIALLLAACAPDPADLVTPGPPPPPPPPPGLAKWSDPATWAPEAVPVAGADATVPAGKTIELDISPPPLNRLTISGTLVAAADKDLDLVANQVFIGGTLRVGSEEARFTRRFTVTLTGTDPGTTSAEVGTKVVAVLPGGTLDLHGEQRVSWTRLAATAASGATALSLQDGVDWRSGDRVVIASTEFDQAKAEEAVVSGGSGNSITLQAGLRNTHWGTLQSFGGRSLDERAEVGLLTHNITIQGDSASLAGFGGHLIMLQGATARIEDVSFTRMGQSGKLGRYPVHWHLAGDVSGQYIRDAAIWKTNNRCLTIHGTDRLVAQRNVCYDHLGHGYFLEDGAESSNTLERNLGLLSRAPAVAVRILPSDATPATFWITNPGNVMRGNAAAGSTGFGFWFALPAAPTGLSTGQLDAPRRTPLGEFSGNVAHSNRNPGLNVDDGPTANGTTETTSYAPREGASAAGALVTATFQNFTAFKNSGRGVWLRGSNLRLDGAMLADNMIGATFAASETWIQNSVVVGESDNRTASPNPTFPIRGYEFYDGTVGATNVAFVNFVPSPTRPASALGYNRKNGFSISQFNFANALSFVNANQVWLETPQPDKDGDKSSMFKDGDGTVTGATGRSVVSNTPFLVTAACSFRTEWNSFVCSEKYDGLSVQSDGTESVAPLTLKRSDGPQVALVGVPGNPKSAQISILPGREYEITWGVVAPPKPRIVLQRADVGEWIRVTFVYPGTTFKVIRDGATGSPLPLALSLAEIDASQGDKYYFDPVTQKITARLYVRTGRTSTTLQVVPS
ncbi:MAG: G8 domain-containing protein [Gemmatimonadota bacterium]